jgi:hypothetical protein
MANKIAANLGALSSIQSAPQLVRTSAGILYAIVSTGTLIRVYKSTNNGISWAIQDYPNVPKATSSSVSAAIDGNGVIHISIVNGTLFYIQFSTTTDTFGRLEKVNSSGTSSVSIAVDSNNIPHIVAALAGALVNYFNRTSGTWSPAVTLAITGQPFNGDIQIDQNNVPQVSILDSTVNGVKAFIGNKNNATSFTSNTIEPSAYTFSGGSSITIDSSGNTWVAYQGASDGRVLLVKHNQKDPWSTWQTALTNGNNGKTVSMAADANDIYILYERNLGGIAYDRYDTLNNKWLGETILQAATTAFRPHNPMVKWSQYFNNGDTGANNSAQQTIEYLFDDGSTVYTTS